MEEILEQQLSEVEQDHRLKVWRGGVCGRREGECGRWERKKQLKRSRDINSKCRVDMWKGEGV